MKILVEIFGKKFNVNIEAKNLDDAKYKIMGKMKFTHIQEDVKDDDMVDRLKDMFGMNI